MDIFGMLSGAERTRQLAETASREHNGDKLKRVQGSTLREFQTTDLHREIFASFRQEHVGRSILVAGGSFCINNHTRGSLSLAI